MNHLEQTLYLYLVAPVVRDCGPLSPEAEIAFATWQKIVAAVQPDAPTN